MAIHPAPLTAFEYETCASCGLAAAPASIYCEMCANAEPASLPAFDWWAAAEGVLVFGIVLVTGLSAFLLVYGAMVGPELRVFSEFASVLGRLRAGQ